MKTFFSLAVIFLFLFSCANETTTITTKTGDTVTKNNSVNPSIKAPETVKNETSKSDLQKDDKKSPSAPVTITDSNFDEIVLKSDKVVLIDFWAVWCGPCKRIAPYIKEFASEYEGKAIIGKVDVDKNRAIASKFKISSIPTLLIFKNGQPIDGLIGAHPKESVKEKLDKALGS